MTPEGLLVFCISYFEDIYWEKVTNGEKVRLLILDEVEMLGVSVVNGHFDR